MYVVVNHVDVIGGISAYTSCVKDNNDKKTTKKKKIQKKRHNVIRYNNNLIIMQKNVRNAINKIVENYQ